MNQHFVARSWFVLNVLISLFPPLYWSAGEYSELILGFPASLVYFTGVSLSITGSILFAYWCDVASGDFTS